MYWLITFDEFDERHEMRILNDDNKGMTFDELKDYLIQDIVKAMADLIIGFDDYVYCADLIIQIAKAEEVTENFKKIILDYGNYSIISFDNFKNF